MTSDWRDTLARSGLIESLAAHDARIAGTLPLGIDVPGSDVDILCHAPEPDRFAERVWNLCCEFEGFALYRWVRRRRPVIAKFAIDGLAFELFGDPRPIDEQDGWRHFVVERRLLAIGGAVLRQAVLERRASGAKTEPAFADALRLEGDPYAAMTRLSASSDAALEDCLNRAGLPDGRR